MPAKEIIIILFIILFIFVFGTLGYHFIEHLNLLDSIYMTVITITTVGFREVKEFSTNGKILTMIISLSSYVIITGMIVVVNYFLFSGEIKKLYRSNKMGKNLNRIKKHYIIAGAGEVGEQVIKEFYNQKIPFVVVDKDRENLDKLLETYKDLLYVWGDVSLETTLQKAGIERAVGIVITLPDDADVLFLTISAKQANPNIRIAAQVANTQSVEKIKRAGVHNVILSKVIAGVRLSQLILKPKIISFLDVINQTDKFALRLEEIELPKNSHLINRTLADAQIPQKTGLMVIAVKNEYSKNYIFNPSAQIQLTQNMHLIVLGEEEKIQHLQEYIKKG